MFRLFKLVAMSTFSLATGFFLVGGLLLTQGNAADKDNSVSEFDTVKAQAIETQKIVMSGGIGKIEMISADHAAGIWFTPNRSGKGKMAMVMEPNHESPYWIMFDKKDKPVLALSLQNGEPMVQTYQAPGSDSGFKFHSLSSLINETQAPE